MRSARDGLSQEASMRKLIDNVPGILLLAILLYVGGAFHIRR